MAQMQIREERTHDRRAVVRKGAAWRRKEGHKNFYAIDEDESETIEETLDNHEELQSWFSLEERENEQCQEVVGRRDKQKVKEANHMLQC